MNNNKSFEDAFGITVLVMFLDIAISGAIIPLLGTYLGVSLMRQVAIILAIQALVGLCFYRIWKCILRNWKKMRSYDKLINPYQYREVEPTEGVKKIEELMNSIDKSKEGYECEIYVITTEIETDMCLIYADVSDFYPNFKDSDDFSEMHFVEALPKEEFGLRYEVKKNGKVKWRERPSFKKK